MIDEYDIDKRKYELERKQETAIIVLYFCLGVFTGVVLMLILTGGLK